MKQRIKRSGLKHLFIGLALATGLTATSCRKEAISASGTCSYTTDPAYDKHPKAAQIREIMQRYVNKGLPGISVYVQDDDGIYIGSNGMADLGNKTPMTPCMVSKGASVTKMFVGVLAMKIFEQEKANIDDKAALYLPEEVVKNVANADKVTLRQLMNHTTGIYDVISDAGFYLSLLNNPDRTWDAASLVKVAYGKDPLFAPGEKCAYSNTNTLLLSMCLDKILGYHHSIALHNEILKPLGLNSTYYYSNDALPSNVAQGYYDLYNNGTLVNVTNYNTGSGNGYVGLYSTVTDLARFTNALLREKSLLSPASLSVMQTVVKEEDSLYLGPGMMRRYAELGEKRYGYGHAGRDLGYNATAFYFPEYRTTVTYLVNYGTNGNSTLKPVFLEFEKELLLAAMP